MLGTRTQGGWIYGAYESTELWRHPLLLISSIDQLFEKERASLSLDVASSDGRPFGWSSFFFFSDKTCPEFRSHCAVKKEFNFFQFWNGWNGNFTSCAEDSWSMELFSRRRWTTGSAQQSNIYGMMPFICWIIFWVCHKHNSFPFGPIQPSSPFNKELHGWSLKQHLRVWALRSKLARFISCKVLFACLERNSLLW